MKEVMEMNYIIIALLAVAIGVLNLDSNWRKVENKDGE
jgi:hypothetical protein